MPCSILPPTYYILPTTYYTPYPTPYTLLQLMLSQVYYLIRSKADGRYLVARPNQDIPSGENLSYLLLFREHFEALSYLNTHGIGVAERFAVETIPGQQLGGLLTRWGFTGVGIVQDPLLPKIEFFSPS